MAQQTLSDVQDNFYRSAISAGIAVGITALIGFVCFTIFGAGIETTMHWLVVLGLVAGGMTFTGVAWGVSAGQRKGGSVPARG